MKEQFFLDQEHEKVIKKLEISTNHEFLGFLNLEGLNIMLLQDLERFQLQFLHVEISDN